MTKHSLPYDAYYAADQNAGADQKGGLRSAFALTAIDADRTLKLAGGFTTTATVSPAISARCGASRKLVICSVGSGGWELPAPESEGFALGPESCSSFIF